jgi:hypothetical protein
MTSPYLSPRVAGAGISTSVPYIGTGCCGFEGPIPPPLWIRCPVARNPIVAPATCQEDPIAAGGTNQSRGEARNSSRLLVSGIEDSLMPRPAATPLAIDRGPKRDAHHCAAR